MRKLFISLTATFIILGLVSCASAPKTMKVTSLVPLTDQDKRVTKSGVTIEVNPINESNVSSFPILGTKTKVIQKTILGAVPADANIPNVLLGLTLALKITNNTGHIIRMAGSAMELNTGGKSVPQLDKEQIKNLWVAEWSKSYPGQPLPPEIIATINQAPYWDEALRILPGRSAEAFVAFNTEIAEGIGQAALAIFDLVTNTDAAGNPTERTNFDFNFKELTMEVQRRK